ncbi:Zinc finger UBR-type [Trinorchestia longiramus]|nr:Zinc finger UBR-type [Trinorchestia longiramus]
MATSGGVVDWSQLVKPIIYVWPVSDIAFNKQDIPELVKAILKCKEDIVQHEEQYEAFYSSFCILAADYLASHAHCMSVGGVVQCASACKVLLQHLVSRVGSAPLAVTIPAAISHNHSHSHISAHAAAQTPVSSAANNVISSSSSIISTSVLSPSSVNILTNNAPVPSPAVDAEQSDSDSHSENVPLVSSSTAAPTATVSSSANTAVSGAVTIATPVSRDEREKVVNITDKHLVLAIKALCRGSGYISRSDQSALVSVIRSAKLPSCVRTHSHDKDSSGGSSIKDGRRNRNDPSAAILEQLISPLHDLAGVAAARAKSGGVLTGKDGTSSGAAEPSDVVCLFGSRCEAALQSLGGGATLLDVCLRMPSVSKYNVKYKELLEGKGFAFPATQQEVLSFKAGLPQVVSELGIVARILRLPVLEPLTSERLQKLASLSMASLLAALHVAVASAITAVTAASTASASSSKTPPASARDDELDVQASSVTEKALLIFSVVLRAVNASTRAGGHVSLVRVHGLAGCCVRFWATVCEILDCIHHQQNLQLMGGWLLSTGLHQLMVIVSAAAPAAVAAPPQSAPDKPTKEDKGKSPTKKDLNARINLNKVQQGLSAVSVALAQQCCELLASLLEDVAVEGWSANKPTPTPAKMSVLESFSATNRLARIFNAVPLNQLLFYLATVSYRKEPSTPGAEDGTQRGGSGGLGRGSGASRPRPAWGVSASTHGGGSSQPHSISDSESCSSGGGGGSSHAAPLTSKSSRGAHDASHSPPLIPDKSEPHGFLSLATRIFSLMNHHLVECECAYVQQYVRAGLADTHMIVLAAIIKDLDRDTAKADAEAGGGSGGPVLQELYDQFSQSLYRYTHNLVASGVLSDALQSTLLHQLGVSPWVSDGDWPLLLLPRTLTVLAQVLLLRQRRDKDDLKCDCDTACVIIWQRVVATLVKAVTCPAPHPDHEMDDLNVEHAQLLLFLFHALQLMQKKAVLLSVASALITVAPVIKTPMRDSQLLHLSRLLLIFEYLMKNLYEAPQTLIEQVQWNLFSPVAREANKENGSTAPASTNNLSGPTSSAGEGGTTAGGSSSSSSSCSSKMYHVWRDIEDNYQKYCQTDDSGAATSSVKPKFYTLTPVDTNSQDTPKLDGLDGLVRQSLTTQKADALLKSVTNVTSSLQHDLRVAGLVVSSLVAKIHSKTTAAAAAGTTVPMMDIASFADLLLVDAVLARLQVTLDDGWQRGDLDLRGASDTHDLCQTLKITADQLPVTSLLSLIMLLTESARHGVVHSMSTSTSTTSSGSNTASAAVKPPTGDGGPTVEALSRVLAISGDQSGFVQPCLSKECRSSLLNTALQRWTSNTLDTFPQPQAWKSSQSGGDVLPGESFVSGVVLGHVSCLSAAPHFSVAGSPLKHVLRTLITFTTDLASWYSESEKPHSQLVQTLVSIAADATCDGLSSSMTTALERLLPTPATAASGSGNTVGSSSGNESGGSASSSSSSSSSDSTAASTGDSSSSSSSTQATVAHHLYGRQLVHVQALLKLAANYHGVVSDRVLSGIGDFLCLLLEDGPGRQSLRSHFQTSPHFCTVLLSPLPPKSTALKSSSSKLGKRGSSEKSDKEDDSSKEATGKSSVVDTESDSNVLPEPILLFLIVLFQLAENQPKDADLSGICNHVWSWVESGALQRWLSSANSSYYAANAHLPQTAAAAAAPAAVQATPPLPPPSRLPGLVRKRKDRKSTAKTIIFNSPFSEHELSLNFLGSAAPSSSKGKTQNEASVLDDDDDTGGEEDEEPNTKRSGGASSSDLLTQEMRLCHTWSLLEAMANYACAQETQVAKSQCASLLRSLEGVGNVMVEGAVAAATPEEGCRLLEPVTTLLPIMMSLASGAAPQGHVTLFRTATHWLQQCKQVVLAAVVSGSKSDVSVPTDDKKTSYTLTSSSGSGSKSLVPVHQLLSYLSDVLVALKLSGELAKNVCEGESGIGPGDMQSGADTTDSDLLDDHNHEDQDDDEEILDDSEDESVCNKLCTYTLTQKEFVNQHWYHCHTCQMEDGVGVCSICAKVCHKGHDVTYAKFGSFFCDCGAKEDGSCQALVKRTPSYSSRSDGTEAGANNFGVGALSITSGLRTKRALSPSLSFTDSIREQTTKHRQTLARQIEGVWSSVCSSQQGVAACVLQFLNTLMPTLEEEAGARAALNSVNANRKALHGLHTVPKTVQMSDHLMFSTLGAQEGAFENVRLNYTGDQGQTIRQLVATHAIRRVAMAVMTSATSRRQHLAITHEKGKIVLLQLSSLLRQKEVGPPSTSFGASKRKLTISRLTGLPLPFLVLSLSANPCNDDYLAVCGLKDCHVLVFSSTGSVMEHLVLHVQLESSGYIIKVVWLPGQQTQLAVVTADFVKIYDLSVDALSPQYYLLLPSGKIRDACFASLPDGSVHLLLMTSSGYICTQELNDESSAKHGPFYVTNALAVDQTAAELKDVSGVVGGGGVSIHYSQGLQLLCFSYSHGRSFMAPLTQLGENAKLEKLFPINVKPSSSSGGNSGMSGNGSGSNNASLGVSGGSSSSSAGSGSKMSPLCQWSEVHGHPGLFTCFMIQGNVPVLIYVKPESIMVQEIKIPSSKSKVCDIAALRHTTASESRTTLLLLCEDGSLRVFTAFSDSADFWMSSNESRLSLPGEQSIASLRTARKKKNAKHGARSTGPISFAVDFFEHCNPISDVEFGGSDLLQVYNVQQLKNRLNSQSTYVACSKPGGFQLEVTNKDASVVMCGARVSLGGLDSHKNPTFIKVFGRSIHINTSRSRWYDIPFTREESLKADKKLVMTFGPSTDPSQITIIDTVKIYGESKEEFGWPDDEEYASTSGNIMGTASIPSNSHTNISVRVNAADGSDVTTVKSSSNDSVLESLFCSALDALDGCFSTMPSANSQYRQQALDIVTRLINLQLTPRLQSCSRSLLSSLHDAAQRVPVKYLQQRLHSCLHVRQSCREINQ